MTIVILVGIALLGYVLYVLITLLINVDRTLARIALAFLETGDAYSPFFPVFSRWQLSDVKAQLLKDLKKKDDAWQALKEHEKQPDMLNSVDNHIDTDLTSKITFESLDRMIDGNFAVFSGRSKYRDVLNDFEAFKQNSFSRYVDETRKRKAKVRGVVPGGPSSQPEEGGSA
jgi:hypothetical protein